MFHAPRKIAHCDAAELGLQGGGEKPTGFLLFRQHFIRLQVAQAGRLGNGFNAVALFADFPAQPRQIQQDADRGFIGEELAGGLAFDPAQLFLQQRVEVAGVAPLGAGDGLGQGQEAFGAGAFEGELIVWDEHAVCKDFEPKANPRSGETGVKAA